jgi:adenosylmethionine-8-amino-7-oxononanoate aminotransferase
MPFDTSQSEIRTYDNLHWFHPWEDMSRPGQHDRTIVTGGQGITITDETGRRFIDGAAGMWCVQIGYGVEEMAKAAAEQMLAMPYNNPFAMTNAPASKLARKLKELAPGDLGKVLFTTGGSTAVDSAIRFVQFRNNVLGRPEKKLILAREDSYHGSTYLTASLSGKVGNKAFMDHADDLVRFVPSVHHYRFGKEMTIEQFTEERIAGVEQRILDLGPERVAAFIAEPVQASGGVIVAPEGYLRRVWELCRKYDILYISDEVVTGFGRLGHWFASKEVFGIEPDIITTAKGLTSGYLPLGAALISEQLFADVSGDNARGAWFGSGFTYAGHAVSTAVALKNIEIIERLDLLAHVRRVTPHFQARLHRLASHPIVGDVRGLGLVGCIDCRLAKDDTDPWNPRHEIGARLDRHCQRLGLILRPILNMCVFSPPLIITDAEIDTMFDIMEKGLDATLDEMTREGLRAA